MVDGVSKIVRRLRAASVAPAVAVALAAMPAWAADPNAGSASAAGAAAAARPVNDLVGNYLAGRDAQATRDFPSAAEWYEKALGFDPKAPELISRTFLMEVSVGRFDRARQLAEQELKLDPSDALAELVLLVERLKANDAAGALKYASALPSDGIHRFIGPLVLAWARMAAGDLAGADTAMQGLDKFNGFQLVKAFQLGLLYDFAGKPDKAAENYNKALSAGEQLNWRVIDVVANFETRSGHADKAKELYKRFLEQNTGSELAQSVLTARQPGAAPQPPIRSAAEGLAEAMFDLASVLNQAETVDLALVYDRFALALRPDFPLAQLLLADVLSAENKPEQSLAVLGAIPANSPYSWSARLRMAINLETLDRTDEALASLKQMTAEKPQWAGAEIELGDILRAKKRFAEAVDAYDQAVQRVAAAGMPERWVLFYDRGVSLERSGQWDRAEADLQHALQLKADQPLVLNYLGYSWIDRGINLDRGLDMIKKAVELRPDDGYITDSLGWAYYRLGQYDKAVEYLDKAIELVPEDPTINDHLGDAYWQTGRLVEARYQWKRALQFGPEKDEVKPIEAKLERGLNGQSQATPPRGG